MGGLVAAGLGLGVLYLVVLAVTMQVAPGPVRPVFDGFAPPEPYRWVSPPPDLAARNQRPVPASREVPLDPAAGSQVSNVTTPDGQILVSLELGSVASRPPDHAVLVEVEPLDPATLGPLPAGLAAAGNAYRVAFTYRPSGTAVATLDRPGDVALSAAFTSEVLLYAATGDRWETLDSRPFGGTHGRAASLRAAGYFLTATTAVPGAGEGGGPSTALTVALLGVLPVVGGLLLLRLRPRPNPAGAKRSPSATRTDPRSARPRPKQRRKRRKRR